MNVAWESFNLFWDYVLKDIISCFFGIHPQLLLIVKIRFVIILFNVSFGWKNWAEWCVLIAHACDQLCKQFRKAHGLTYKVTNYKLDYPDDCNYGLLLDTDVVTTAIASNSDVYGFKFSTVSSFFYLWFLRDTLSRVFPYKLNGTYFMIASSFPVP